MIGQSKVTPFDLFRVVLGRLLVTWKNFVIWIVTLKDLPRDGRNLWKASVLKKKSSLRNGKTRVLYRSYAWWGRWDQTEWHTLSGKTPVVTELRWIWYVTGPHSSKIVGCKLPSSQSSSASSVVTSTVKPIENTRRKPGKPKWRRCLT